MSKNKPLLIASPEEKKDFNYVLGNIVLNFTLRTDIKAQLVAFKEILTRATKDVDAELAKFK